LNWLQVAADALAFLLGGLGAAFAGVLVQLAIQRAQRTSLRRALAAEIRENYASIPAQSNRIANTHIVRTAWDDARSLSWPDPLFAAIADAYAAGDELNTLIDSGSGGIGSDYAAKNARAAFGKALELLEK